MKMLYGLGCLLALVNTAFSQEISKATDPFTGIAEYSSQSREARLEEGSPSVLRRWDFSFIAFSPVSNSERPYFLRVSKLTRNWTFTETNNNVSLKIDGAPDVMLLGKPSRAPSREVLDAGMLKEQAIYALSAEQLDRLSRATSVEFKLTGHKQSIRAVWNPNMMLDAAAFLARGPEFLGLRSATDPQTTEALAPCLQQPKANAPTDDQLPKN